MPGANEQAFPPLGFGSLAVPVHGGFAAILDSQSPISGEADFGPGGPFDYLQRSKDLVTFRRHGFHWL
jgi:hypothetical protein